MRDPNESLLALVTGLARKDTCRECARSLAVELGAEDLIAFIRDPVLRVFLPAPGFPQTIPGARRWHTLLKETAEKGRATAELPGLSAAPTRALGVSSSEDFAVVLVGGSADGSALIPYLPLLGAALAGQWRAEASALEIEQLRMDAAQGEVLTRDLDAARRDVEVLLAKTEDARRIIHELNQDLERRVTVRTQELRAAMEEMEAFSYTIAHDLRAPLRAMYRYSAALQEDYQDRALDAEGKEYLLRIGSAARKMDRLIEDLLSYSRLTRTDIRREGVDLAVLVEETLAELSPQITQAQAQIHCAPQLPIVLADRVLLRQVLVNLLLNAITFVAPGVKPDIKILAEHSGGRVRLSVKDNGIGIDPLYHERVFKVFERVSEAQRYPGTGIGLAIVKRAMEKMGGTVGLRSEPSGGSTFWVVLEGTS